MPRSVGQQRCAIFLQPFQLILEFRYFLVEKCQGCIGIRYDRTDEGQFSVLWWLITVQECVMPRSAGRSNGCVQRRWTVSRRSAAFRAQRGVHLGEYTTETKRENCQRSRAKGDSLHSHTSRWRDETDSPITKEQGKTIQPQLEHGHMRFVALPKLGRLFQSNKLIMSLRRRFASITGVDSVSLQFRSSRSGQK
jgi:hypothetical protein